MPNLFAKVAAVGILGGGFAITGDLAWLASRGQRLLGATTVPSEMPRPASDSAPSTSPDPTLRPPVAPAERPPVDGPDAVDLARLRAGQRVVIWLADSDGAAAGAAVRRVTLDVIDAATGDSIVAAGGLPRRVRVRGPRGSTLVRGERLGMETAGLAHATDTRAEWLGPIAAFDVVE